MFCSIFHQCEGLICKLFCLSPGVSESYRGCGWGTRWHSWLRHCTTSLKDVGSIPVGVIGIFH